MRSAGCAGRRSLASSTAKSEFKTMGAARAFDVIVISVVVIVVVIKRPGLRMMMMRNHIVIMIGASVMVQAVGAMSTVFLRC